MAREIVEEECTFTRKVLKSLTCDMCGRESARGERWDARDTEYDVNEVEVEVRVRHLGGSQYPEGRFVTVHEVDLCPWCFRDELIPWLKTKGVRVEPRDEDDLL